MQLDTTVFTVFTHCVDAIKAGNLIHRESRQDKEFHFQNWVRARLQETTFHFEAEGRNSYPDFRLVSFTEGYEVKGLAYPGRELNYDCNSQVPSGAHNGRRIFYLFGRYPAAPDGNSYPLIDLVICHGDFLNADHNYVHQNKSIKGFGSYGDILIRDRKMYVAPTPFGIASGVAHTQTLILPDGFAVAKGFRQVGTLVRKEAESLIAGYTFDLRSNTLTPELIPNPSAGREHVFHAWRLRGSSAEAVAMRARNTERIESEEGDLEQ
ncbi:MAG TPA: hypothetical protein PLD20_32030 [Blastocatellia bacterium]|nr:hypothetical protein [Blastocatellia bacterium]HMV83144.1 hypothetical protein [Blastocatellia bacterium]HMX24439.1 hypothetical protein [Blastocatellia bacterium]HMZ22603.1 hypothetical protein [Blastocatellia bacterium]HNG32512.1 hypothetical protein [Blastocatellia bacterium]